MKSNNIGYHTRLRSDNTVKVQGGCFGGALDYETVNRLVKSHFDVMVKPSGHVVFVDKNGREVMLYLTVDAEMTDKGIEAKKAWLNSERIRNEQNELLIAQQQNEIEEAMQGLSYDEIIRRLKTK